MKDKIVHVMGLDFDGCLLPSELKEGETVREYNEKLFAAMDKQNAAYDVCLLLSSSNRQSHGIDLMNQRGENEVALDERRSSFPALKSIAEGAQSRPRPVLCPMLLADAYAGKPDGFSFARAILKSGDTAAYHPGYVFDDPKASLIYTQVHMAANLMRGCDFLIANGPLAGKNLFKLKFLSNAAYVYDLNSQKMYYVNRIEKISEEKKIVNKVEFERFMVEIQDKLEYEEHDFEVLNQDSETIKGFYLSTKLLNAIQRFTYHRHQVVDYPIVFDFLDDRIDIFKELALVFGEKKGARQLPRHVILRLNLYNAEQPNELRLPVAVIRGSGDIDLKPKATLLEIAKAALNKSTLTEADYRLGQESQNLLSKFMLENQEHELFKNRMTASPTIEGGLKDQWYATLHLYNSCLAPDDVRAISDLIMKLKREEVALFPDWLTSFSLFKSIESSQNVGFVDHDKEANRAFLELLLHTSYKYTVKDVFEHIKRQKRAVMDFYSDDTRELLNYLLGKYMPPKLDNQLAGNRM